MKTHTIPVTFFPKWLVTAVLLWWLGTEDGWLSSTAEHGEIFSLVSDRQVGCSSVRFRNLVTRMEVIIQKYHKRELSAMLRTQSKLYLFSPTHPTRRFSTTYSTTRFKAGGWNESGQDKQEVGLNWGVQKNILPKTDTEFITFK